jgi:hypothetical protein
MSKARELIEELSSDFAGVDGLTPASIKSAFERRLEFFNIEDVSIAEVTMDFEGDINVTFIDDDDDELSVIFLVDDEDDTIVALVDEDDAAGLDDDEVLVIDLTSMGPPVKRVQGMADFVNLSDLTWLNKSTMMSILKAGEIGVDATDPDDKPAASKKQDAKGNRLAQQMGDLAPVEAMLREHVEFDSFEIDEQGFARVVRGGKVVKLPLVRRKRRRVLTGKQRQGFRKAAMKRKAKKGQIARKRKRSLRIRGSRGIKKRTGNTSRFKVQGGADRRR